MNERIRLEIVRMSYGGASQRRIARALGLARKTVARILQQHELQRAGTIVKKTTRRPRLLDLYEEAIAELLERYPDITAVRLHEELTRKGFRGGYSIVKDHLRAVRPRPLVKPVVRFETAPGVQAQMDYSPYTIHFLSEGVRKVYAFSYILAFSRRQYVRFVESQQLLTTLREHVRAFEHLGGCAASCLYDNMKVVVTGFDGSQPLFNTRFLAFATHYGFQPRLCRPYRPQTKGKVERPFYFLQTNLLNARSFSTLEHLNEVTRAWLAEVADQRIHRHTQRRPIELYEQEKPHLVSLPDHPFDTSEVVYRTVMPEGYVAYLQNLYSVPWNYIGALLPVRITETELIIYKPDVDVNPLARHELFPRAVSGKKRTEKKHRPPSSLRHRLEILRKRFAELGDTAGEFFDELVRRRRNGKDEAYRILALMTTYRGEDLRAALERAFRYRAFSVSAIERILTAQAQPKTTLETLSEKAREHIDELLQQTPIEPRSTQEYQNLLEPNPGVENDERQEDNDKEPDDF
jgi:transposase